MQADLPLNRSSGCGPSRRIEAQRVDAAYELRVQEMHWPSEGRARVSTGDRCVLELFLPEGADSGTVSYAAEWPGQRCRVGAVNFVPPHHELDLLWTAGRKRSMVCLLDPSKIGLLAGIDWHWRDIDPVASLDVRNERVQTVLRWLVEETLRPSFASDLRISSLLTLALFEIGGRASAPKQPVQGRLSPRQLATVRGLVERGEAGEGTSLPELAAACELPAREFSTRFRNTVGMSLRAYVAAARIARAKLLLSDPGVMIKQVAYLSGFDSASAFGTAFKQATGLTPAAYRRQ